MSCHYGPQGFGYLGVHKKNDKSYRSSYPPLKMVYTSNADVFYKRKKNTYQGKATHGIGYGYSKSGIASLLKAFTGNNKRVKLFPRKKTGGKSSILGKRTREGREFEEGGNSLSKCHYGSKTSYVPKSILDTVAKQVSVQNGAGQSESTVGLQAAVSFNYAAAPVLLVFLGSANEKLIMHSIKAEVSWVNSSSSNSTFVIYDIIARKDTGAANASTPVNAWASGIDSAGGSATDYQVIGSVPTESTTFNQFYKVVQRTRVSMGPGQMHRHEVSYNPNKLLAGLYLTNVAYNVAGLTMYTLIVHHGMPAHDSTTKTDVRVDISAMDYVQKISYEWRQVEDATTTWSKSNTLATSFAVGEEFVNEAVGQVQNAGGLFPGTLHT